MRLWAISDLHVSYRRNRERLATVAAHPEDWLIVAGDIAEDLDAFTDALRLLTARFAQLVWVPGNHDLWHSDDSRGLRGEAKYRKLVARCCDLGVLTPEDPYALWPGEPGPHKIVPLFLLYDYTYAPEGLDRSEVIAWAQNSGVSSADEHYLSPAPHESVQAWCADRCAESARRLEEERDDLPTILINHWPLRQDLAVLPRIPRFSPWCGTTRTEDWHVRFGATVVVYGHLHIRRTQHRDGVRFEEVSLGYPRQYDAGRPLDAYLREILPGPGPRDGAPLISRYP